MCFGGSVPANAPMPPPAPQLAVRPAPALQRATVATEQNRIGATNSTLLSGVAGAGALSAYQLGKFSLLGA
jgi:hypothetical protein